MKCLHRAYHFPKIHTKFGMKKRKEYLGGCNDRCICVSSDGYVWDYRHPIIVILIAIIYLIITNQDKMELYFVIVI